MCATDAAFARTEPIQSTRLILSDNFPGTLFICKKMGIVTNAIAQKGMLIQKIQR